MRRSTSGEMENRSAQPGRDFLPVAISQGSWRSAYFAGLDFASAGICTFSTCRRICVPDSSLTLSVFETITGPGVLGLDPLLKLRPFSPITPCGMPTLIGLPFETTSSRAPEVFTWVEGDSLTVMGACNAVCDALDEALEPPLVRPEVVAIPRPEGGPLESRIPPPIMDGGSICDGSSTRDLLITGSDTAWTTA